MAVSKRLGKPSSKGKNVETNTQELLTHKIKHKAREIYESCAWFDEVELLPEAYIRKVELATLELQAMLIKLQRDVQ